MAENGMMDDLSFLEMMVREINQNFLDCNDSVLQKPYPSDGQLYCNATFDGYTCWDFAKSGTRVYGHCPSFLIYRFGQHIALPYKDCNSDGTWYRHPETMLSWTNYSPCTETEKVTRANSVLYVYFSGYSVSVLSLVMALTIFTYFRQLKCTRVTIHKHLFLSYIITAVTWILYYSTSSFNHHVVTNNPVWCRTLHVLAQYVTVCNYAWMFCEGFYLHTILVRTFTNERTLLWICYVVGWGVPIIPSVIYSALRATNPEVDKHCWHEATFLIWIFSGPIALSLVINVLFLINILRILCSKVRSTNLQDSNPVRQSFRASLILIPLLGLQYFVLPFRPNAGDENGRYVYDLVSACLTSFQGFLVSLLFCFLNGEVLLLMKNQAVLVRRRVSRTETGKSYIYSAVHQQGDEKATKKRSIQLVNQTSSCKPENPQTVPPVKEKDINNELKLNTTVV